MKNWAVPVTAISAIVGLLIAAQFKAQENVREELPSRREEELVVMFKDAQSENQRLSTQVDDLKDQIKQASSRGAGDVKDRTPARWVAMTGPGVEVQINDSAKTLSKGENPNIALVHNEDLLKIVNELRASGAEALSLNDQRLVEASEISCAGPTILVNKSRIAPPFVIHAIGNPDTMLAALQLRGGVVDNLQFYGIQVTISRKPSLSVPMYHGGAAYQYAKPLDGSPQPDSPASPAKAV